MAIPKQSIGSKIMGGIKSAGAQIKSDFQHATNKDFGTTESRAAYDDRTAASIEKMKNDPIHSQSNKNEGAADQKAAAAATATATAEDVVAPAETFAANKKRYDDYMAQQKEDAATKARMGRATSMYESQNMGAGFMPRQMQGIGQFRNSQERRQMQPMPQFPQQNQATSPAFRYAAQNYDRLGGQQRMYGRPQEMMSQRERSGVNNIYDQMRQVQPMSNQMSEGQQYEMMKMLMSGQGGQGGKGAAPTQNQPQQSDFGRMLAARFGGGNNGGNNGGFSGF